MNKAFYKCATCAYHKVNYEEEKCTCILEKLNPKRKDMLLDIEDKPKSPIIGTFSVVSGSWGGSLIRHFYQWICTYHEKFLNCPGYKKYET